MAEPDDPARRGGSPRRRPPNLVPRSPPPPPPPPQPPRTIGIDHGSPPPMGSHALHPPAGEEVVGELEAIQLSEDVASAPPLEALSEEIINQITNLVEGLFSNMNLATNEALARFINSDSEGHVPISCIACFEKVAALVPNACLLATALRTSSILVVSADGKTVRRQQPITKADVEEIQMRIVVVENIPKDSSNESLKKIFSPIGRLKTIQILRPEAPNLATATANNLTQLYLPFGNRLHAFVEYEHLDDAEKAVAELSDKTNWICGLRVRVLHKCLMELHTQCSAESSGEKTVEVLKSMGDFWRTNITAQPSALDQRLLMMILSHVSCEIYLFNLENSALEGPVVDNIELIISEVEQKSSFCSVPLDTKVAGAHLHSGDVFSKMRQKWDKVPQLISMVEDLRKSFSLRNAKEVKKVHFLAGKKNVFEMSEFLLENILSDLEERRYCRKYFPPAAGEIRWYRQMRMMVNSIVIFLKAKDAWLQNWKSMRKQNAVSADQLVVETVRKCCISWEYILPRSCLSDVVLDVLAPRGQKLAMIFDELSEIQFLLRECNEYFGNTLRGCSENKSPAISITSEVCREDERKRKSCHVRQVHDVEKRRKRSDVVDVSDERSITRITRRHFLAQILCVLRLMKNSSFSESSSTIELRLYARIMEHVTSRIWLFNRTADAKEKLQHAVYVDMLYENLKGDQYHPSLYAVQTHVSFKRDSREQYLDLIFSLVCKIEKEFSFSTPNAEDMILYEKVKDGMDVNLIEPLLGGSTSGSYKEQCDFYLASRALQAAWSREFAIANDLGGEFEKMVTNVWPGVVGTQLKQDMMETKKTISSLAEFAGCYVFDSLLLTLYEVDQLLGSVFLRLNEANLQAEAALNARVFSVPVEEALRALKVVGTSATL